MEAGNRNPIRLARFSSNQYAFKHGIFQCLENNASHATLASPMKAAGDRHPVTRRAAGRAVTRNTAAQDAMHRTVADDWRLRA